MSVTKNFWAIFILFLFFLLPITAYADTSCCSQNGGTYACDYATSKLYCKDGTVSTDCTCRPANTPTPTPSPTPTSITLPTSPSCPPYATYDSTSKICKCITGYIVNGNVCVTYQNFCWTKHGGNSFYNTNKNECDCSAGYVFNNDETNCISFGQLCENKLGDKSYYDNTNNTCNCYQGYSIQNNQCSPIPTPAIATPQTTIMAVATNIPTPNPTSMSTQTPTKVVNSRVFPTLALKGLGKEFISVKKPQENGLIKIITSIWNFLIHLI